MMGRTPHSGQAIRDGLELVDFMEEDICFVLVGAEIRDFLDFACLKTEDQTPGQVKAAAGGAPAPVVVHDVFALLGNDQRLGLKAGFAQLVEERQDFLDAALFTRQRMMPRDAPDNIFCHDFTNGSDVFAGICRKECIDFRKI
jgi:hypothetical protein